MGNETRFVDPFELPGDSTSISVPQDVDKDDARSNCYDVDLHDNFDWLAQPYIEAPHSLRRGGRANES